MRPVFRALLLAAALIATDHDAFDYELIAKTAVLVVDTRGRYKNNAENIVKA